MSLPRTLDELTAPASDWPRLLDAFAASKLGVEVTPPDDGRRRDILSALQVTVASTLGALAWNAAVVLVDHGWVRVSGAGHGSLPGLHVASFTADHGHFEGVAVAQDVLGGLFVVHGQGLPGVEPGEVVYWGPDTLAWSPLGLGHSALVDFLLSERLALFAADLRWEGWEDEVRGVRPDEGLAAYPPPWSREGRQPGVQRSAVPMGELIAHSFDVAAQFRAQRVPTQVQVVGD